MYRWAVARVVRFLYRRAIGGDDRLMMKAAASDVAFTFPGENSFATTLVGREALHEWLARFTALDPTFEVRDVVVSGAPWNMTVAVRFRDAVGDDYENEGVEWIGMRWGHLHSVEVFLDTERISAWERRQAAASASVA